MKKIPLLALAFGIVFLFFIQSAGTLVESIYILDLLKSKLDEKVLGVLFFFSPLAALPFLKKYPHVLGWALFGVLLAARGLLPYLTTAGRVLGAGAAFCASFGLFLLLLSARPKGGEDQPARGGLWASAGLGLAVGLSALLRTVNSGVEYSLTPAGGWAGWALGLALGGLLWQLQFVSRSPAQPKKEAVTAPLVGVFLLLTLVYFAFSAPAVIARWTEGSYPLIVSTVSLLSLGWAGLALCRPRLLERISPRLLLGWNALFCLCLTASLLAPRVSFPAALGAPEVVVGAPPLWQQIPLGLMLLLFPVLFADLRVFAGQLQRAAPTPVRLAPGILIGGFILILLVFADIFTNVWGYVRPVSPLFRNLYGLPFFLLSAGAGLLLWLAQRGKPAPALQPAEGFHPGWAAGLGVIFLAAALASLPPALTPPPADPAKTSLTAMTMNVQGFNDVTGEKSFDRQIALIQRAAPDILSLQETDTNRISYNNNDYVRYFADRLGYYAYYGPTPLTGTYGTAVLSKYPLENTRAVFMYSDKDETGVAEAEVTIGGRRFTIYDVHPDSSDPAMVAFAQTLLARAKGQENVIALGDYNLRDYEEAYKIINGALTNAWTSVYPSKIGAGVDMSGENRIDHIFLSPNLKARSPVYVLPPESATDHAVHWTEITW